MIPPAVQQRYSDLAPYVEWVGERVRQIVWAFCEREGYAFQSRRKEPRSLAEKIESGRYKRWSDIDDQFACTIIVPTLTAEAAVLEFLAERFQQKELRQRNATQKDPAVFRFDATRFIGVLKDLPSDAAEGIRATRFEVQVRSALEHAWSVATHAVAYKADTVDWRKLRLAAQLKATVEQLDMLIVGFEQSAALVPDQYWPEVAARVAVESFFRQLVSDGTISRELQPASWMRFCDNYVAMIRNRGGYAPRRAQEYVDESLEDIREELRSGESTHVPTSVSLLQFAFGILVKRGRIRPPLTRYTPLVTDQLLTLYPEVDVFAERFDFERIVA